MNVRIVGVGGVNVYYPVKNTVYPIEYPIGCEISDDFMGVQFLVFVYYESIKREVKRRPFL